MDDGTGNFQNTTADLLYLNNVVMAANSRLANLGILNIGSTPYIQDARIRIEPEAFYFHPHTIDWDYADSYAMWTKYVLNDFDVYGLTNDDKYNVQHIFLSGSLGTGGGHASAIGGQGYISHIGWYPHYQTHGAGSYSWGITGNFVHEFMHACGLDHNFHGGPNGFQCNDGCSDNDPTGLPCPIEASSNNYMDYFPGGYNSNTPDPGLSECQLGKVHYNLNGNAGTIYRALLTDHCTNDPSAAIHIVGTHTWTASKKLKGDLFIEPGATLTITCQVHFPYGARLIVKPNGRLIVDEGLLTNECGDFWSGIEVHGTSAQHQFGYPNATYQGSVYLLNGALIENAREGVRLWNPGDYNSTGGILIAEDATFRNCRRAVEMMKYDGHLPLSTTPYRNRSSFKNVLFEVNEDYFGGNDFATHVSLWAVDGITFTGCRWKNTNAALDLSEDLGHGITSLDADYRVQPGCDVIVGQGDPCPTQDVLESEFFGLDHGIHALGSSNGNRTFQVRGTLFKDNVAGLYVNGVVGAEIVDNDFQMCGREVELTNLEEDAWDELHRAIFTTSCYATFIDDNTITRTPNAPLTEEGEGIVVGYSEDHNDLVFRNSVTDMFNGYVGEGRCASSTTWESAILGLQFICNLNTANPTNIWSRLIPGQGQIQQTIRRNQGDDWRPADNTFDQWTALDPTNWDFDMTTSGTIQYWHKNSGNYVPVKVDGMLDVEPIPGTAPAWNCENRLLQQIPYDPNDPSGFVHDATTYLETRKLDYGNTRYLYEQLIDGGNTDEVVQEIMSTWPQDAWDLRDYLIGLSPFVSSRALREMVQLGTMPATLVAEVLVANPDATQEPGFMAWVQEESGHPLPHNMLSLVVASWEQNTYRAALEATMARHHGEMTQAAHLLMQHHRTDTAGVSVDSIRGVWQRIRTTAARYAEALTYAQQGQYGNAKNAVLAIPTEHQLGEEALAERQRMLDLLAFFKDVHDDDRNEAQLDSAEVAELEALVAGEYDRPASWGSNVLCFFYDKCRGPLTGGDGSRAPMNLTVPPPNQSTASTIYLRLHPNPSTTWVAVDYYLPLSGQGELVYKDITGRELRKEVVSGEGQTVWDTRIQLPGSYTVELRQQGVVRTAQKLIVRP